MNDKYQFTFDEPDPLDKYHRTEELWHGTCCRLAAPFSHDSETDLAGYLASSLALLTFTMTSMRRLRLAAITSNIAFITCAILANLPPILILHGILLPINLFRLYQIENQHRRQLTPEMPAMQVRTDP